MYLGTVRYDDIPSSNGNGRIGPPSGHEAGPGFVARASSDADLSATSQRVLDLQERIKHFKGECTNGMTKIDGAEKRRIGIPQYGRGWPLMLVGVLAILTVALEYLPAYLFTQIFSDDARQWRLLTITFTAIPALLAIGFGELLHRLREPATQRAIESTLLTVVALATLIFLAIGYLMRVAYTSQIGHGISNLDSRVEAIAFTSVAAIGIILTVVSSYYREGLEMFKARMELGKHRRDLQANEGHLRVNERDLDRALTALYGPVPTREQLTDRAEAQRRGDADKLKAYEVEQTASAASRQAEAEKKLAESEKLLTESAKQLAESEKQRAEFEQQRTAATKQRAEAEKQRAAAQQQRTDAAKDPKASIDGEYEPKP
jgi:hypothetical protein